MLRLQWRRIRSRYPWLQIVQTWRFWLLVVFTVTLLTYAIISFKRRPFTYLQQEIKEAWLGDIEFDFQTGLYFHKQGKNVYLRGSMPDSQELGGHPSHCAIYNLSKYLCASWYPKVKLEVENVVEEHAKCQVLTWTPLFENYKPHTCFSLSDFTWYGGSLLHQQIWPLNKADIPLQLYRTHDLESYKGKTNVFANTLDWFWISSAGIAVIVDNSLPVHVSINQSGDKLMCFHSKSEQKPVLKYTVCKAANIRKIHRYVIKKYVHLPLKLPKDNYFMYPMWSTNPVFRNSLNQGNLLKYGQEINNNGFESCLIDINDNSLALFKSDPFDKSKFPNSQQSLMILRGDYKMETFLPVSPFVPVVENTDKTRLVQDLVDKPVVVPFEGQEANIVNLLDDKVTDWYIDKLQELKKEFGINGFHLIGGVSDYYNFSNNVFNSVDIEKFSRRFASSISEKMDLTVFSNFASKSQKGALFIQLPGQLSSWGNTGGLKSLIPSVLTLGVLGYPFVIPNTIGGMGTLKVINESYTERIKPDRELYVRWMGIAAFMPCMMFSYPPWLYDEEVVTIAKQFTKQHKEIVAPLVIKAAREFEHIGTPIIQPLWWTDPQDTTSLTVDDEYLIGDTLLVAPIVSEGKTQRDIYIPQGKWKDMMNDVEVEAGTWIRDYHIPLDKVATFMKVKS
ncbi:myogenesis-regulating glycosidase-like [Mercenaria mercenaria]|uniref:myogenesis-regulating glycosidase-like n=1 Tax=Mercenaria mercenaria TaxID=6596 RepID=UPI001E1DC922|nr:myogenesis-regulating glycosidase-like [Mercenaria mercenaria]